MSHHIYLGSWDWLAESCPTHRDLVGIVVCRVHPFANWCACTVYMNSLTHLVVPVWDCKLRVLVAHVDCKWVISLKDSSKETHLLTFRATFVDWDRTALDIKDVEWDEFIEFQGTAVDDKSVFSSFFPKFASSLVSVMHDRYSDYSWIVNPRRACARRVTVVVLCVCLSVFSILPSHTVRHPTRGISSYSAGNAVKPTSCFLKNCSVQKLEAL